MFRFYNPYTYEHLYTTDVKEAADLRSRGWNAEGIGWYSPIKDTPGVVKIYRLYNPYGDDHLYTTEVKEKDDCIKRGWKLDTTFEAYGFISKQLGANAGISRLFNPYEKYHTHLFSANKKELEDNIKRGWRDEHVRWYVPGKPAETTPSATDTDVNVSTGPSSGSSHEVVTPSKPTPKPVTPTPSVPGKPAETSKPAQTSKYSEAARKDIFGNKKPDAAITDLTTAAKTAETEVKNLKEKGINPNATPEDKAKYNTSLNTALNKKAEADFKVDYATKVKALNEAAAALKKAPTDTKTKEAYDKALKEVEADENKFTPVTYTVHFKNDPQGNTETPKDMQVTIYKCIATQMYKPSLNATCAQLYSVERALDLTSDQENKKLIPFGSQGKSKRITYDAKNNYYTVEYGTWKKHDFKNDETYAIPKQLPTVATDDSHNVTELPELNLSMLATDTAIFHTSTSDDKDALKKQINANEAAIKKNGSDLRYLTLDSYRAAVIALEKASIEGDTEEAYNAQKTAWEAYKANVSQLPYYTFPTALTSKQDPNLVLQTAWLKLKVAEIDYNAAKTKKDAAAMLKARKDAVQAAAGLMNPGYVRIMFSRNDPMYIRWHLLGFMDNTVLGNDAPDQNASKDAQSKYQAYVNAYTTWMNTPTEANMTALKKAEKTYKDLVKGKQLNNWSLEEILCDGIG